MVYKYREVRGTFTALTPDTTDADTHPNIVPLAGSVVLTPIYKDGGISFSESGHFDQPQPKPAAIDPDGILRSVVTDPVTGAISRQPLFLPVTVDERANQEWTYEASFPEVVRTDTGERVDIPTKRFAVEEGDGPLNLVAVATTRHPGLTITKGAPGAGLLDITAVDGEIVFAWDNGNSTSIPVPEAVPGPEGDPGPRGPQGIQGPGGAGTGLPIAIGVPAGTSINTIMADGIYRAPSAYTSVENGWPEEIADLGSAELMVISYSAASAVQIAFSNSLSVVQGNPVYTRVVRDTGQVGLWTKMSFTPVEQDLIDGFITPATLADGHDLDTVTETGQYTVADAANAPEPGQLLVRVQQRGAVVHQEVIAEGSGLSYRRAGVSSDWQALGGGFVGEDAYVQHQVRQTQFMHAMGGPINTGGRGAVAFRIDHGFKNFAEQLLPLFRAREIVPSMVYNPRNWGRPENEGYTAADLNTWVAAGEVEVWNHGASHADVHTEADLYDEIVNSLTEIEAQIPAATGKVWGFAPPGVDRTNGYGGFGDGATPEKWDTAAGGLILKHHAVTAAYLPGTGMRVLDGSLSDGLSHFTLDRWTVAQAKARIDEAINTGRGVQFMIHPYLLGTDGNITGAEIEEVLDYAVSKRESEQILTLSPYQLLVADATQSGQGSPYDSGDRDITGLLTGIVSGQLILTRIGHQVWLDFQDLVVEDADASFARWASLLPVGFRPPRAYEDFTIGSRTSNDSGGPVRISAGGEVLVYRPRGAIRGLISFYTREPEPATKPGTPA